MSPWLWMLLSVVLSGLMTLVIVRVCLSDLQKTIHAEALDLAAAVRGARSQVAEVLSLLSAEAQQLQPETLWLGAFLPTDEGAAGMEQQIRSSEDRAISAAGQPTPSRAPWKGSAGRLRGAGSTRPARPSGERS